MISVCWIFFFSPLVHQPYVFYFSQLDVDIMMGTFTKSFGAVGGYICASRAICAALKKTCPSNLYHGGIPPVACKQIIQAMSIIMGTDGTNIGKTKLTALKTNSNYFRQRMMDMGCHVLGDWDSPICPVMLYNPAKIAAFSRECYERNVISLPLLRMFCFFIFGLTPPCATFNHCRSSL